MKCRCRAFFLIIVLVTLGCQPAKHPPQATRPTQGTGSDSVKPIVAKESTPAPTKPLTGPELYARHCAACHGARGDAQGVAARFLYPKPRNFRTSSFRLVSTVNGVPSRDDIESVLVRGMPGSAMPPWPHLSPDDRKLLVDELLRLRQEGLREEFVRQSKEEGEEQIDETAAKDFVDSRIVPGAVLEVPAIPAADAQSVARGKALYLKQGCNSCHGNEGRGDGQQQMVDTEGLPTRPRDLTQGIYKGSPAPDSFYRRIALGMPGTPMPASANLKPAEIIDLLHFLRSLSSEEQRDAAVLNRQKITVRHVSTLPDDVKSSQWDGASPVALRTTPLWWRNDADPGLTVQALHDGHSIALRLSWADGSPNVDAARAEAFRDAVAVELFHGAVEPFLGMGSADAPVDVWFWQAEPQQGPPSMEQVYPRMTVDVYPFSETVAASAEYQREGTKRAQQPPISLPAKASGNPVVPATGETGASSLTAGGPGSVTFRLPKNRLVKARGQWKAGRWTVVMTRPLAVDASSGVPLAPGQRVSAAIAVWDGAQRDRDGQKSITIWQDLELEKSAP